MSLLNIFLITPFKQKAFLNYRVQIALFKLAKRKSIRLIIYTYVF